MIRRCKQPSSGAHSISFHNSTTTGLTRFHTSTIIELFKPGMKVTKRKEGV